MALTPNGETGRTIQLKRTSLAYDDAKVTDEQLNYGEPLYNDNDKTLLIGDSASTTNDNLKVIKCFDRNKANSQVFLASTSNSTLNTTSGIGNLYNESNQSVFVKDKNWGNFDLNKDSYTTYAFTINSSNVITKGNALSTKFSTLPCLVDIPVSGMQTNYVPTISLFLSSSNSTNVANIKAQQKAFGCISRVDTYDGGLYIIFFKEPATSFSISVVGG